MISVNKTVIALTSLIIASLATLAAAQTYYWNNGNTYCVGSGCYSGRYSCSNGWCWSSYYGGYVCCSSWYGSGWGVALWVFLSFILIACCIWCCIAAGSSPSAYYAEPAVEVVNIKTTTQPQVVKGPATTTRASAGQAQYMAGGTYTVQGQPVNPSDQMNASLAQGQPVDIGAATQVQSAPVSPAAGQPVAPVHVAVNVATPPATAGNQANLYGPTYAGQTSAYPQVGPPTSNV